MQLPNMKKPCANCPFRKDSTKGWLGSERMTQILGANSFVCHKTISEDKTKDNKQKQCAGFMLIKQDESEFFRLAKTMDIDLNLTGKELIFESKEECIKHHKN